MIKIQIFCYWKCKWWVAERKCEIILWICIYIQTIQILWEVRSLILFLKSIINWRFIINLITEWHFKRAYNFKLFCVIYYLHNPSFFSWIVTNECIIEPLELMKWILFFAINLNVKHLNTLISNCLSDQYLMRFLVEIQVLSEIRWQ